MSSAQRPYPDEPPPPARGLVRGVLWVVFAPIRLWMKKNRPDDYAASQST